MAGGGAVSADKDFRVRYYERQVERLVTGLRELADDVARESVPRATEGVTGSPRFLSAAERVNRTIAWRLANLSPHRLFDAACHADMSEAEAADVQ
jgi:hypothetical protein